MNFIKDISKFFNYLNFVDIIFFGAIITLLILLVTLVYFIKINKEVLNEEENIKNKFNGLKKQDKIDPVINEIVRNLEQEPQKEPMKEANYYDDDEEGVLLDLDSLTKKLQSEKNERLSCDEYEKDQEEKAIISYDELVNHKTGYAINYEKEEVLDDVVVKKVDLNDLVNTSIRDEIKDVRVISYQKEEAFLSALKELNSILN